MAKYGMSMCALGMAEEFRSDKIAVNALWPRTAIWTAAMAMLGSESVKPQCRTVDIMADAAYVILTRDSANCTGNFFIDDEVLREVGVTDFDKYACEPGHPLMPDFFLEEAGSPEELSQTMVERGGKPKFTPSSGGKEAASGDAGGGAIGEVFKSINAVLANKELVNELNAIFKFDIKGSDAGVWHLSTRKDAEASCGSGESPLGDADCTMVMDSADFVRMFKGELKPTAAFMGGKLKITGNMGKALKLEKLMGQMHKM